MSAGRGIVHSERRPGHLRESSYVNHGLQLWVAVPQAHEEDAPFFEHTPASAIPEFGFGDAGLRLLVGKAFGKASPVAALSPTLYLDVDLPAGGVIELPALAAELAVYPVLGEMQVGGQPLARAAMAVLEPGKPARITSAGGVRFAVVGGEPLGPRHMWWNFVSSRKERILQAADDWAAQRMGQVPDDSEFIPLPPTRFTPPEPLS
jgi:redox-sensitive bicupin YhaK (pirin superfamily)